MIHFVIMAGGSGTRFWPKSTDKNPKQFLNLLGKRSMIQMTYDRIKKLTHKKNISVVCSQPFKALVSKHLPGVKITIEPAAKNTMAAICLSAWDIYKKNPQTVVCVLPSDAYIADISKFQNTLIQCSEFSKSSDFITCIGIKPTYPATGYGYIQAGENISTDAFKISRFIEKPQHHTAEEYLKNKNYFWNAGIFVFKAQSFVNEVKKYAPLYFDGFEKAKNPQQIKKLFKSLPKEPVDIALMEKTNLGAVVPGDFGWNDVGSWPALEEVISANHEAGLVLEKNKSPLISINSKNNIISFKSDKVLSLIGVENLIIVETKDALLICNKNNAQDIKLISEKIKNSKRKN